MSIEKEFLAEESEMDESHVHNSFPINEEFYQQEYQGEFIQSSQKKNFCGDCKFFIGKCTTSEIEAKYGDSGTPACSEYINKQRETE